MDTTEEYMTRIRALVAKHECEKKGCAAFVKTLPEPERQRLAGLVEQIRFQRRHYGGGQFYCWALHPLFEKRPIDPWPASQYPKAVLMADFAIRTPAGGAS